MVNLELELDEGIILQATEVERYGIEENCLNELILTNKNLICVYDKNTKVFSKSDMYIDKISLSKIKVVNGNVQTMIYDSDDYGKGLQILISDGNREFFVFYNTKKELPLWENAIKEAVLEFDIKEKDVVISEIKEGNTENIKEVQPIMTSIESAEKLIEEEKRYIFCSNCGEKLIDTSKFCNTCGTPTRQAESQKVEPEKTEPVKVKPTPMQDETIITPLPITPPVDNVEKKVEESLKKEEKQSTYSERKQEFAGKIIKCPSCGAELQSFDAVCPNCGHEINSQNVSSSLKEFIDSINEYDKVIANDPEPPKTGWKTWSKGKKFLWIILNIVTSFIPLVVYLVFPLIKPFLLPKSVPVLSADEKRKAALIENYTFPNEREATIEALMFTKSKIAFLASEKFDKKTLYWTSLWSTKAEQLNQRANIILKDDKIVESTYADITASKSKVDKNVKIRAIIGAVIIVVFVAFVVINGSIFNGIGAILNPSSSTSRNYDNTDYNVTYEWPSTGISSYLPLPTTEYGKIRDDNETRFNIELYHINSNKFDDYVNLCKEYGFTISTTKTDSVFYAYNDAEYSLDMFFDEDKKTLEVFLDAPLQMSEIKWPDNDLVNRIPKPVSLIGNIRWENSGYFGTYIDNITEEQYSEYVDQCINAGFTVDYSRGKTTFYAYDKDGYYLAVEKHLFDQMYISIKIPENND